MRIRIASWNTWKNEGDYRRRLPSMARVLQHLQPDVVLLQECFRAQTGTENIDTAGYLSKEVNMHLSFAPARMKVRNFEDQPIDSASGHAILSKAPLEQLERRELVTTPEGGERIALFARTQIEGKSLSLACVHFAHRRSDGAIRSKQFSDVIGYLAQFRHANELSIIGGDFNMVTESEDFKQTYIPESLRLLDTHEACSSTGPTMTVPSTKASTGRRIDLVLSLKTHKEAQPTVLEAGVAGTAYDKEYKTYPSDHALVWADLES